MSITSRELSDSVVLIVGGSSGVGLATARRFATAGTPKIAIVGRDENRGRLARDRISREHPRTEIEFVRADANIPAEADRVAQLVQTRFGRIDVLVNSTAGALTPGLLYDADIAEIPSLVLSQMLAPLLMSKAVLKVMREHRHGVILNIASDASKVATPGETIIGAAMAGIVMFSRTLAIEAKRDGIRVNALTPSLIEGTPTTERLMANAFANKLFGKARQAASLGAVEPEHMAELLVFLASPAAARITGQAISVNGGISAA